MVARSWFLLGVGCAVPDLTDNAGTTDTVPSSPTDRSDTGEPEPEPEFGVLTVTVDGREYELELVARVSLADQGRISMEWRAEHPGRIARLTAFLLDEVPIETGTYEVGQWGGNFEQFGITLRLTTGGDTWVYQTPTRATTKGSLTIDALDRDAMTVSASWTAELEKSDDEGKLVGTETVSSTMIGAPLTLY